MHLHGHRHGSFRSKVGLAPAEPIRDYLHGQIAYHDFDGPGFRPEEQRKFVINLRDKRMMFLRNHGTLTHGRSIAEAFCILMHNLERSCEIQIAAQSGGRELALPPDDVIKKTVQIAQGVGDEHFAEVGFNAVVRQLNRIEIFLSRLRFQSRAAQTTTSWAKRRA